MTDELHSGISEEQADTLQEKMPESGSGESAPAEAVAVAEKPAAPKTKKWLIIASMVGALLIAIGAFLWLSKGTHNKEVDNLFNEGLLAVELDDKWGFVNKKGNYVINPQFDGAWNFYNGLAAVEVKDKWGYINKKGEYVIEPQFDSTYGFSDNGLAAVEVKDKWGYINKEGEYVIAAQFDSAYGFSDNGLAAVKLNDKWGYINKKGKYVINPQFASADPFADNGLAAVELNDKWGYINKKGEYVINPQFQYAYPFFEGVAVVNSDWEYGLIDKSGNYIVYPAYNDMDYRMSNGMLVFENDEGKLGYLDKAGKEIIPAQFDSRYKYSVSGTFYDDGYAVVRVGESYGVINRKGSYVINPQFDNIYE